MSGDEAGSLIPRPTAADHAASSWCERFSVSDWLATAFLILIGFWLDKAPPFEIDIAPQLAHDYTIAYPHTPADKQQVPAPVLWRLVFFLPVALVAPLGLLRRSFGSQMRLISELLLGVLSSVAMALVIVCLVKNHIGRLRPDFIARCQPQNGRCTGDPRVIMEGRKSFPSGHSALSFASLAYVSLCWYAGFVSARSPLVGSLMRLLISSAPWSLALLIALSRYQDYWHHWQDIAVGTLLGHACAYGAFRLRFPVPSSGLQAHVESNEPAALSGMSGLAAHLARKTRTSPATEAV